MADYTRAMPYRSVTRLLAAAQLWQLAEVPPEGSAGQRTTARRRPVLVSGWEDAAPFCATVCTTDLGLRFCRACPTEVADRSLATRRAVSGHCPAGVRLLAFPVPARGRGQCAVLRVAPPRPTTAATAAGATALDPAALRAAARAAERVDGATVLRAARRLRARGGVLAWQIEQRERAAQRRREAAATRAQMVASSMEASEFHRAVQRQRTTLARHERRLDRLARETVRAADLERARVAHEIHDTAAQSMVAAYRFIEAARATVSAGPPAAVEALDESANRVRTAIREVRSVLAALVPPGLEELGAGAAIGRRLEELTAGSGMTTSVEGELARLDAPVEHAVYGMAAEAISNAVRHSGARTIAVRFGTRRGRATVEVADDGSGFVRRADGRGRGDELGLLGLTRRARWVGGRARIDTAPGKGTVVRIAVPLPAATDGPGGDA